MKLYNTLSTKVDELQINNNNIKIYLCGITVYDESHIGHARTIIIFDVLHRYLLSKQFKVTFIQNFTDIDDKIIKKAKSLNTDYKEVSEKYIKQYLEDASRLNVLEEIHYPKATDNINYMIELITYLLEKNYAYITLNGIYFQVKKFSQYGKLSKKTSESIESGARIEIDPTKKDPLDFALWKFSSEPPLWKTPWGTGRPGWHIECSAMALKYLGNTIDIHGGGNDLIFPHHENEIAQSESITGEEFAKIWMHCGMVNINSEKMSKSIGNIVSIQNAINKWGANTIRILCLSTHYSKPLEYTVSNLVESQSKWRMIENCFYELQFPNAIEDEPFEALKFSQNTLTSIKNYMENDFNTSLALSEFMKFVSELNNYASKEYITINISNIIFPIFREILYIFGLRVLELTETDIYEVKNQIFQRNKFRKNKEFEKSDNIRRKLKEKYGIELIDHKNYRTIWKKVENSLTKT
ncbi:MAG: cysteine--tRNA ligase [Nitrososphaeraceae archaeon]|nr:cysteine--tRNA ligase [Nitrososphaeraceae archaeon]